MRARLLPLLMLFAATVLALRLIVLWTSVEALAEGGSGGPPLSEVPPPDPIAAAPLAPLPPPGAGLESLAPLSSGPAVELPSDPLQLTDEDISILQALSERRREIEAREREVAERSTLLAAAEARIDEKIERLKSLQDAIEQLLAVHDEREEAQLKSLVKIYENMKPRDAARILDELDMPILLDVVERMRERKAATILAEMRPGRAREITLQLAERRNLPVPKE